MTRPGRTGAYFDRLATAFGKAFAFALPPATGRPHSVNIGSALMLGGGVMPDGAADGTVRHQRTPPAAAGRSPE